MINGQAVGTVYIRGLAFKARAGGRRQMVLLQLKAMDERDGDLWLIKYFALVAVGIIAGASFATIFPWPW